MVTDRFNKFVYVCIGMIFSAATLFVSCAGPVKNSPTLTSPTTDIHLTNQGLAGATTTLSGTTEKITQDATSGLAAMPPSAAPVLNPKLQDILIQAGYQKGVVDNLKQSQAQLTDAEAKSRSLESAYNIEHNARLKAESAQAAADHQKFALLAVAFVVIGVGSIAVILSGLGGGNASKIAFAVGGASFVGTLVCVALVQTYTYIPYVMGGVAVVGSIVVVYRFYQKNKAITTATAANAAATQKVEALTTHTKALADVNAGLTEENHQLNQAATELVKTTEATKPFMSLAGRKHIFGDGPVPGVIRSVQSEPTRQLVSRVRNQMTNLAPSVPETIASDLVSPDVNLLDDEEYHAEVMAYKPDTKSVRSRMSRAGGRVIAGSSTVVVLR